MSSATFARCGSSSEISAPDCPCLLELERRGQQLRRALDEREALALDELRGNVLAVVLRQRRLGIEQIDLRRRAGHEEIDDALGPGRELQRSRPAAVGSRRLLGEHDVVHQRRQRQAADAERGLLEEMAARDGAQRSRSCMAVWRSSHCGVTALVLTASLDSAATACVDHRSHARSVCGSHVRRTVLFRHRLVQIQQHVRDHRPGRQLGDRRRRARGSARAPARTATTRRSSSAGLASRERTSLMPNAARDRARPARRLGRSSALRQRARRPRTTPDR